MEDQRKLKENGAKLRTFGADLTPSGHRQELLHRWEGSRAVASRFLARRPSLNLAVAVSRAVLEGQGWWERKF